jgi:hypothetical protein
MRDKEEKVYSHGRILLFAMAGTLAFVGERARAAELYVGAATADITPPDGAPLTGYHDVRCTQTVHSPLTANVMAIECREGDKRIDFAILVACDLCVIRPGIQAGFRAVLGERLGDFPTEKLVLAATHIRHVVRQIALPARPVAEAEVAEAKQTIEPVDQKKDAHRSDQQEDAHRSDQKEATCSSKGWSRRSTNCGASQKIRCGS